MSNTSKETLRAEIVKLCADQGKEVPAGLEDLKQVGLFDLLESLTGNPDPRRPVGPGGAVRVSQPPGAPPAAPAADAVAPPAEDAEGEEQTEDETPPPSPSEEEAAAEEQPKRYRVAEHRLVHCLCGPLGAFQEIRAIDLGGGEDELEALLAEGTVEPTRR